MEYYNVEEVSTRFSVTEETVRRWIRSGKMVAFKTSKKSGYLIPKYVVENFGRLPVNEDFDQLNRMRIMCERKIQYYEDIIELINKIINENGN